MATAQGLRFLQTLGFQCRAFCGSRLDLPEDVETMLQRHADRLSTRHDGRRRRRNVPVLVAVAGRICRGPICTPGTPDALEVTIFPNEHGQQTEFYRACGAFLDADRPDAVVTYGGDPLAETLIRLAKNRDLPLVFWLHNFAYHDPRAFALADYVIVPSQFNRRHYWESIGLASQVLPLVMDWERVGVDNALTLGTTGGMLASGHAATAPGVGHVTFVNPQATKGLYVFARIAELLAARRPDIPLLVIAGRSASWLAAGDGHRSCAAAERDRKARACPIRASSTRQPSCS